MFKKIDLLSKNTSLTSDARLKELLRYEQDARKCTFYKDSSYAYLLRKIGLAYYNLHDFSSAVQYTKRAVDVIAENISKPFINASQITNCYYNLYLYYDSLHQDAMQRQAIDSCIEIDLRLNLDHYYACLLLEDKIHYLFNNGDYTGCIKYADLRTTLQKYFPDRVDWVSFAITYKVCALVFMGELDQARQSLDFAVNKMNGFKSSTYRGTIYNLLGIVNDYTNDNTRALDNFQRAFRENASAGYKKGCAEALTKAGVIYSVKMSRQDKALPLYRRALTYADGTDSIFILTNIANVYVRKKLFDSAFIFFQEAFDCISPGFSEKNLLQSSLQQTVGDNITEYVTGLVIDKADALLEAGSLTKAISGYKIADGLLARVKQTQLDATAKLFWSSHTQRLYEKAIQACYLSGNKEDAFYFFEKSRAALLNDQLNEQRSLVKEDILKQAALKKQILLAERELANTPANSKEFETLQKSMLMAKQQLDLLIAGIKKKNPFYYQSIVDTSFISVDLVRKKILNDHAALIELFIGDSTIYTVAITKDKIELFPVAKTDFENTAASFMSFIADAALLNSNFNAFVKASQHLNEMIFKRAALPAGRIIISPGGRYLPFEAMVTSYASNTPHYFLEDHAITYSYSARYLLNDFATGAADQSKLFIGFAPVNYAAALDLPSLAGSDQSLRNLRHYFSNENILTGKEASRKNFLQQFYQYRIIQLYTHATDRGLMNEPVIYFADSALLLSDLVYENKPVTDLIVLSACQTGAGKLYRGEGVFSFNRGFASLGIPASVSNLWAVENESTYLLTELFYKYVKKGLPFDEALQQAKLEFIRQHADFKEHQLPYYWAASVLVGQTNTLPKERSNLWLYLLIALGCLATLPGLINRRPSAQRPDK